MNEAFEEFEKFIAGEDYSENHKISQRERQIAFYFWENAWNHQQAKIDAQAEEIKPKWIAVAERLPIESGWFPVKSSMQFYTQKWTKDYFCIFRGFSSDVTHWFELPD